MAEVVEFSRSLYDVDAVRAAADAYGGLATIAVKTVGDHVRVEVSEIDPRVADRLVDALCNHALYNTVDRHRARQEP